MFAADIRYWFSKKKPMREMTEAELHATIAWANRMRGYCALVVLTGVGINLIIVALATIL